MKTQFADFREAIADINPSEFHETASAKALLAIPELSDSKVKTYYAPFDYTNCKAKLVLVGITPGQSQMNKALYAACTALNNGHSDIEALHAAKIAASFGGKMQTILINLLDSHKINTYLGISSCEELWSKSNHLVNFTSCLRNPVFSLKGVAEVNYTGGTPNLATYKGFTRSLAMFGDELNLIPNAMIVPLGRNVANVIQSLVDNGSVPLDRVLNAEGRVAEFPHPSGENAETVNLAIGEFPDWEDYAEVMFRKYQNKVNGKTTESSYKAARYSYWQRARHTRVALKNFI